MGEKVFRYGEEKLSAGIALEIARGGRRGILSTKAAAGVEWSVGEVEKIVKEEKSVYGVNTGFGSLCSKTISPDDTRLLQYNILKSHSTGVGEPIPIIVAKLMLILKAHSLARGFSGVSISTLERILWHIDKDIIPQVPSQGSVGASGDLAPLAHLFLPLIGLGKVYRKGCLLDSKSALPDENIHPLMLGPKEGLALINGTQFMAAWSVRALEKFQTCLDTADLLGAMSLEGMKGSVAPFKSELHELRAYDGTRHVAQRLRNILTGSEIVASHADCSQVQDPYSLRCMPQVHGAGRNAWKHFKEIIEVELNSVTDNPIVLSADQTISGGNFHGEPIAIPIDYATIAASELGNIADRRIYLLLDGLRELPPLLMEDSGVNSGFMITQYTSAALASENKTLCYPASADSIPTSHGQEDHVSMGSIGGRKLNQVLDNLENIQAVELICAAQALDFRHPVTSSRIVEACHELIRNRIEFAREDRIFSDDLKEAREIIQSRILVDTAERCAGREGINIKGDDYELFGLY